MKTSGRHTVSRPHGGVFFWLRRSADQSLARSVVLGAAIAEKTAKFGVSHIVIPVANLGTNGTNADTIHHPARVTVIPMLIHEFLLGDDKRAPKKRQESNIFRIPYKTLRNSRLTTDCTKDLRPTRRHHFQRHRLIPIRPPSLPRRPLADYLRWFLAIR